MASNQTRTITIQTSNSNGKQQNITLSNINTNATEANMKKTATDIAALSENSYLTTMVTDKYFID